MLPAPVSGAIGGLAGTVLMTMFEYPFWKKWGRGGVWEWQVNKAIVQRVTGNRSREQRGDDVGQALLAHMFHGVAAGVVFVLALPLLKELPLASSIVLDAVTYSLVLWLIFSVALKPLFERAGVLTTHRGLLVALLSHSLYGVVLGLTLAEFGLQ